MKMPVILCALLLAGASVSFAQQSPTPRGEFSGLVFSDFYWISDSHNPDLEGNNGFWIRRAYFTYDRVISDDFSARFRLEANSDGSFSTESFKMNTVVKDLYLRWQYEEHQVLAGISPTPTWGLVEDVWGYRSVEKTPLDLFDFGSSRDFGISATGPIDREERWEYHVMFGNGSSNGSEVNKGKKVMFSVSYEVTEDIRVEMYGDWNDNPGDLDWTTLQGFAAYETEDLSVGVLFARQHRSNADPFTSEDRNLEVASVFTHFTLSDRARGFLRVDHSFDAIPGLNQNDYFPLSNQAGATVVIAGVDFDLGSEIHLMPNIEAASYEEIDDTGLSPASDFIPRLTLFYRF